MLERDARDLERQLSVGLASYQPLYNLQRQLQMITATRPQETSAIVVDQRGIVLAASNNALVGLSLSTVLAMPPMQPLRHLFADCPSASALPAGAASRAPMASPRPARDWQAQAPGTDAARPSPRGAPIRARRCGLHP